MNSLSHPAGLRLYGMQERAKELLLTSNSRIRAVAHLCGFSTDAYFTRRFRRWAGVTPSQFRDRARA